MTRADLAAALGVTTRTVDKYIRAEMPTESIAAAKTWAKRNRPNDPNSNLGGKRAGAGRPKSRPGPDAYHDDDAEPTDTGTREDSANRERHARSRLAELKAWKMAGDLIEAAKAEAEWTAVLVRIRSTIEGWPARAARDLAAKLGWQGPVESAAAMMLQDLANDLLRSLGQSANGKGRNR